MKKSDLSKTELRAQAEATLSKRKKSPKTEADTQRLVHELQVHQIELEMQNEELVQARAESEAVHRQYTDLYDFAPVGYFTLARDGAIRQVNLAGANLLGAEAERGKLIQRRLGVFVSAQSRTTLSAFLDQVFTSGKNEACEIELLKAGAAPLWVHIEATTDSDKREACRAVVVNISKRKQAEQKLAQYSEHLEKMVAERTRELTDAQEKLVRHEKLAVLGQLAGSVGHELRNPLGVINSGVYYLKLVQPDADDKVRQCHAKIEQEVRNAEKIINDLLDFARVKSVDREAISVSELVQRVLERYPAPLPVVLSLDLSPCLPKIFADARHMEQVLGNLVLNACQAMPKGGQLSVISEQLSVDGVPWVQIAVKDTGVGIPPENMQKLFEPLFTTKSKGIGLGLPISQKLAEANGGRIEVESEIGKGSTFTVYLPAQDG